jgi:CHAD domain-containing protein
MSSSTSPSGDVHGVPSTTTRSSAKVSAIGPSSSLGDVASAALRRNVKRFIENGVAVRLGDDPGALHDLRVASRRLRAALSDFAPILPVSSVRIRHELGQLGGPFGAVRDLDVQIGQLVAWQRSADARDDVIRLIEFLESERARARDTMQATIGSARWERVSRDLERLVARGPLRNSPSPGRVALAVAPDLLFASEAKVRKAAVRAEEDPVPATLHRLRIRCKRLRYSLEFFAPIFRGRADDTIEGLIALQDLLGSNQDAVVAVARFQQLALDQSGTLPPAAIFTMGQLVERHRAQAARLRERAGPAYRRFHTKPWKAFAKHLERARSGAVELEGVKGEDVQA